MSNLPAKYNVHKIEGQIEGIDTLSSEPLPQEDFFVLLKKDVLAVQALWAYVGVLHVAVELLPNGLEKSQLAIKADNIADLAYKWENATTKKLPD